MRKSSPITMNESGVVLPYVLFITALICLVVMTSLYSYQRDIELTNRHIQQIKVETLFQMAYERIKLETVDQHSTETVAYRFPDGHVNIKVTPLGESMYDLYFDISTNKSDTIYTFTKKAKLE